jgi:hypothetical protein
VKDQSGTYHFDGYKTKLYNESKPNKQRQQSFNVKDGYEIDTTEEYNLLSGHAIERNGTWVQLDFNDKDPNGNFRMKEFHSGLIYNLEMIFATALLKELLNKSEADKLHGELKDGNRLAVSFLKNGNEKRFYIEANPLFKSVNIYDDYSGKIRLNTALRNKTIEIKHKVNAQQHQNQAKKNGMKIS